MSGWSLLQAWTGSSGDALTGRIRLGTRPGRAPLLVGTAWGEARIGERDAELRIIDGMFALDAIGWQGLADVPGGAASVSLDDRALAFRTGDAQEPDVLALDAPVTLRAGSVLRVAVESTPGVTMAGSASLSRIVT